MKRIKRKTSIGEICDLLERIERNYKGIAFIKLASDLSGEFTFHPLNGEKKTYTIIDGDIETIVKMSLNKNN